MSRYSARGYAYEKLRRQWLASGDHGWICHLCGRPVPMDALPKSDESPSVDHLIPMSKGGAAMDTRYWRLAHLQCNRRRQNRQVVEPPIGATRRW